MPARNSTEGFIPSRRGVELTTIVADILAATVRILGDVVAGREIRRIVKTGGRNRYRQTVERSARSIEQVADHANVVARRRRDDARLDWSMQRLHPRGADL